MFVTDPDFYPSRISDPITATKGGGKKLMSHLLHSQKFYKIVYYFILEHVPYRKQFEPNDKEL
jgi:hypothetical protein